MLGQGSETSKPEQEVRNLIFPKHDRKQFTSSGIVIILYPRYNLCKLSHGRIRFTNGSKVFRAIPAAESFRNLQLTAALSHTYKRTPNQVTRDQFMTFEFSTWQSQRVRKADIAASVVILVWHQRSVFIPSHWRREQ